MLNNYIKNQGISQTIIQTNNERHFNQTNWNSDYDGEVANISINSNTDGKKSKYNVILSNEDLANILNVQSVNMPIHKRLQMDFQDYQYKPSDYYIELPPIEVYPPSNIRKGSKIARGPNITRRSNVSRRHISSISPNEEVIIPLATNRIASQNYLLTPTKRHRRNRSHVTHKVYIKRKPTSSNRMRSISKRK